MVIEETRAALGHSPCSIGQRDRGIGSLVHASRVELASPKIADGWGLKMFFRRIEPFGCLALLGAVFVIGGMIGVLLLGWKTLLGY